MGPAPVYPEQQLRFSVSEGSWLDVTTQVRPADEVARRMYSGGVSFDPCSPAHGFKKEARRDIKATLEKSPGQHSRLSRKKNKHPRGCNMR